MTQHAYIIDFEDVELAAPSEVPEGAAFGVAGESARMYGPIIEGLMNAVGRHKGFGCHIIGKHVEAIGNPFIEVRLVSLEAMPADRFEKHVAEMLISVGIRDTEGLRSQIEEDTKYNTEHPYEKMVDPEDHRAGPYVLSQK